MRRSEEKFTTPASRLRAREMAGVIRQARLGRNWTQEAAAERARMSAVTWLKIEKGDVSVSWGSWLSAMECLQLLEGLTLVAPTSDAIEGVPRQRARSSPELAKKFDF